MGTYEKASRQTKIKIAKAFWKLYKEKPIEKITVRNITDLCGIHRATFYLHYSDVYAVLEQTKALLLKEFDSTGNEQVQSDADLNQLFQELYSLYRRRREYMHYMLFEHPEADFIAGYRKIFIDKMCRISHIDLKSLTPKNKAIVEMLMHGTADMFIFWADGEQFSFEDMMTVSHGLLRDGMAATLAQELGVTLDL